MFRKFELSEEGSVLSLKEFEKILSSTHYEFMLPLIDDEKIKVKPEQIVNAIFKKIDERIFEGKIIIPLYGIELAMPELIIGNCKIFKVTDEWCASNQLNKKQVEVTFLPSEEPDYRLIFNGGEQSSNKPLMSHEICLGQTCAEITIKASSDKIKDASLYYLGQVIGLLWVYYPLHKVYSQDSIVFGPWFTRQNDLIQYAVFRKTKPDQVFEFSAVHLERLAPSRMIINEQTIKKYNEDNFDKFINLLFNDEPKSEMIERIKSSLFWFGKALSQFDLTQKFLFSCIALEALLSPNDKERIVASIAESAAFILYNGVDSRLKLIKDIKNIYDQRSAIVHQGSNVASKIDVDSTIEITRLLIVDLLESDYAKSTYAELMAQIERLKFSYFIKEGEL